jgi:hypothetical protein
VRIFAGPWIGEFGWELFHWQGMLRAFKDGLPGAEFIVAGRPGHAHLYRDFAARYVEVDVPGDRANRWACEGVDPRAIEFGQSSRDRGDVFLPPLAGTLHVDPANFLGKTVRQRFIRYGGDGPRFDVLVHARSRSFGAVRGWPTAKWAALAAALRDRGLTVASIGTPTGADLVPGTEDLRGIPLEALTGALSRAAVAVGPSSGPMHLASLSGCPHVVWSPVTNRRRYLVDWNPHRTRCEFLSLYDRTWALTRTVYPALVLAKLRWDPPEGRVLAAVERVLQDGPSPGGDHDADV